MRDPTSSRRLGRTSSGATYGALMLCSSVPILTHATVYTVRGCRIAVMARPRKDGRGIVPVPDGWLSTRES